MYSEYKHMSEVLELEVIFIRKENNYDRQE